RERFVPLHMVGARAAPREPGRHESCLMIFMISDATPAPGAATMRSTATGRARTWMGMAMTLRLQINLIVGALTLLFLAALLALQLDAMRKSVNEEVVGANRVAAQ